ncbi:MAG: hypothetical protein ABEJ83_03055 [Candidatus Nanohaloarchaea archaeon]
MRISEGESGGGAQNNSFATMVKPNMKEYLHRKNTVKALLATLSLLFLISTVSAQDTQNNLQVSVNISSRTIVDIQPQTFAWGTGSSMVEPGSLAGPQEEQNGYGRIQIENLGSVDITDVWFNTTAPDQRPFGTGSASAYDSGNFIALDRNSTSTDRNAFVERKEFGLDQVAGRNDKDIIYLSTPDGWDYGRFRNTSKEYFWTVNDTGTDLTSATFRIGINHHNSTQTGSTNLDSACVGGTTATGTANCNGYTLNQVTDANGNTWGVAGIEVGVEDANTGPNDGGTEYCVAINESAAVSDSTPPTATFIKWNPGHPAVQAAGSGSSCMNAVNYTIGGSAPKSSLVPGDWTTMNIRAKIPYGVVSGSLPTGNLVVLANSN